MAYEMLSVGYGNYVARARLIAVVTSDSAPARRLIQDARDRSSLIDATGGRKTQSVLVMDSDHVVISAIRPEALSLEKRGAGEERESKEPQTVRRRKLHEKRGADEAGEEARDE